MTSPSNSTNKAAAVDMLRRHMEKRSLDVKFDLEGTKYSPIENIGIGAYGVVCSAIHKKSKDRVAIKKIPSVFDVVVIAKRTYREIKILKHFKHDNIICIREILKPKEEYKDFRDIYVVFDLMESDLHKIIYSDQELSEEHSRYFLYQILRGLKYIHSANVVHRDLKPGNILVNEDCHVRIGDFGMSRGVFASPDEPSHFMTQYVATRWYRAPEILLSLIEYGTAVDMWSVGCIFAEMLGRKHLFPGKDYISQIKLIIGVLGSPSVSVYKRCQTDLIKKMLKTIGFKEAIPWKTLFPKASTNALDLLSKMLVLNPAKRITVEEAMKHPYLSKYHDPDDEPVCVPAFNFDFEKESMDKDKLRDVIYKEIMDFHKPKTPTLSFNAFIRPAPKVDNCAPKPETLVKPVETCLPKPEKSSPLIDSNTGYQKPCEKQSPAKSVDISALQIPSTSDVEMLSAKCNDNKMMDVQSASIQGPSLSDKENRNASDSKTISDDTKALVKAALLSCQRRQKLDSALDKEDKPKIVTAAMRQKEREDKRKNKKNKAMKLKKLKGVKERKSEEVVLSEADKEMLKRWSVMHKKVDQPIQPKPCNTSHDNVSVKQESSPPKTVHSTDIQSQSPNLDLELRKPPTGISTTIHNNNSDITEKQHNHSTNMIHLLPATGQLYTQTYSNNNQLNTTSNIAGINSQLVSNTYPTGIPEASMMAANNSTAHIDKSDDIVDSLQVYHNSSTNNSNVILQTPNYQSIHQPSQSISFPPTLHSSHISTFSNSPNTTFNTSNHSTLSFDSDSSFASLNSDNIDLMALSKDLQTSMKSAVQPTISQSGFVSTNKTDNLSFPHLSNGTTQATNMSFCLSGHSQKISVSADSGALTHQVSNYNDTANNHFSIPSEAGADFNHQCFSHLQVSHQTPFYESTKPMGTVQPTLETHSVSNEHSTGNSSDLQPNWQADSQASSNVTPPYKSKVSDLKVNCSPKNQQSPPAGGHGQQDWIDFISKQMSKSGLENILPPALSLTPKGTGAGYGVGMVFDSLLVEAQETSDSTIQSPLSSSLLADWLEVSGGNITLADLEDLEQEMSTQSPLPFHHLDIYPP